MLKRRMFAYLTIASFFSTSAFADPAILTANVNFRTGPGTGFESFGVIAQGGQVEIKECDSGATWCAVVYSGKNGFISGRYLNQSEVSAPGWPRMLYQRNWSVDYAFPAADNRLAGFHPDSRP